MAAPEYMNDLRKTSQLGFGVYSWFQLVDVYKSIALACICIS